MFALTRWLTAFVVCASAVSFAQAPKPSLMPFPLEFKRTPSGFSKEDKEGMQREYRGSSGSRARWCPISPGTISR